MARKAPATPSILQAKLRYLLGMLTETARTCDVDLGMETESDFPNHFEQFCKEKLQDTSDHHYQAEFWLRGTTRTANSVSRSNLARYFSNEFGKIPPLRDLANFSETLFVDSVPVSLLEWALESRRRHLSTNMLPQTVDSDGSQPYSFVLPSVSRQEVADLWQARSVDHLPVFSGYKVVYRIAFENTGRIAREVIKFDRAEQGFNFKWWFQTDGGKEPKYRRENIGSVLPTESCYMLLGLHDSEGNREPRFRIAAIHRRGTNVATAGVQMGLTTSTNAQALYPVSARMLWLTIPDSRIADENAFLDQAVGFFDNVRQSLDGIKIRDNTIQLIQSFIGNRPKRPEYLLSTSETLSAAEVRQIAIEDWGEVFTMSKDTQAS
jgi:hypothetical protein